MNSCGSSLIVFTDGASRSNPGHASCAYVVGREGQDPFKTYRQDLGDRVSNNVAEYRGMLRALAYLVELTAPSTPRAFAGITIHSDSKLVVEQLNGNWRVKDHELKLACDECQDHLCTLRRSGHTVAIKWIRREENSLADRLCNQELDEALTDAMCRPPAGSTGAPPPLPVTGLPIHWWMAHGELLTTLLEEIRPLLPSEVETDVRGKLQYTLALYDIRYRGPSVVVGRTALSRREL